MRLVLPRSVFRYDQWMIQQSKAQDPSSNDLQMKSTLLWTKRKLCLQHPCLQKYSYQIGRLRFNCRLSYSYYQSVRGEFKFQLVFSIPYYLCSVLGQRIWDNPQFNNCHENVSHEVSLTLRSSESRLQFFLIACTSLPLVIDHLRII